MAQTPYADLSTLKGYLNIAGSDSTQDSILTVLLNSTQRFVETYTHRQFGWGDTGDSDEIDYSNSDNVALSSFTVAGTLLTANLMGAAPWVVGQNVSLFGFANSAYNGVFKVHQVVSPVQLVIDISVQTGTLSPSDTDAQQYIVAANYPGYMGNAVVNYAYRQQEQFDGLVGKMIYLRAMDIRSVDTLYIGLRNIAQPVLLNHTQYVWRDDGRIILGGAYFNSYNSSVYAEANDNAFYGTVAAGYQTIMVSYWYGYVGVPYDIQLAVLDICAGMYILRKSIGLQEEQVGDWTTRFDHNYRKLLATQPDSLNTLNIWRRRML
jgi:hypothetical protein